MVGGGSHSCSESESSSSGSPPTSPSAQTPKRCLGNLVRTALLTLRSGSTRRERTGPQHPRGDDLVDDIAEEADSGSGSWLIRRRSTRDVTKPWSWVNSCCMMSTFSSLKASRINKSRNRLSRDGSGPPSGLWTCPISAVSESAPTERDELDLQRLDFDFLSGELARSIEWKVRDELVGMAATLAG